MENVTGIAWAALSTPAGRLSVGCSSIGVARVQFGRPEGSEPAEPRAPLDHGGSDGPEHAGSSAIMAEGLPEARRQVVLVSVEYGQTVPYGPLARRAGLPEDGPDLPARLVGQAMGSNPIPVIVPCHRVVASDGLGGYSGGAGLEVKRWLLILEGALPPTLDWEPALPVA